MHPGSACATVSVDLELGQASHQAVACPDSSGVAPFAVLLAAAAGRPARIRVKQPGAAPSSPGRVWQKLVNAHGSVALTIDMLEAREEQRLDVGAAPSAGRARAAGPQTTPQLQPAAPTSSPGTPSCACPRRTHTELEDVGELSLPLLLALAAPMCPLPATPLTDPLPTAQPPLPASLSPAAASPQPLPSLLLPGLSVACSLQAVALAALLVAMLRRRRHLGSSPAPAEDSAAATVSRHQEQACGPARRLGLRDACTSPLVSGTPLVRLLASPFVGAGRRRSAAGAGAGLEGIPEGADADDEEVPAAELRGQQQEQYSWSQGQQEQSSWSQGQQAEGAGGAPRAGSFAGLPPPPVGWTRCGCRGNGGGGRGGVRRGATGRRCIVIVRWWFEGYLLWTAWAVALEA